MVIMVKWRGKSANAKRNSHFWLISDWRSFYVKKKKVSFSALQFYFTLFCNWFPLYDLDFYVSCNSHNHLQQLYCKERDKGNSEQNTAIFLIEFLSSSSDYSLGGGAIDSLLERAKCYALLGQWKTAIFDFTAILKEHPDHVQALCGRGFTYLMLNQQKVW